jgi:hypothetical protein
MAKGSGTFVLTAPKLNVIIGGAWAIYNGVMMIISLGLMPIIYGILLILLGLVSIITTGLLRVPKWLPYTWWILIILGLLIFILGYIVGGVLIIVAGLAVALIK